MAQLIITIDLDGPAIAAAPAAEIGRMLQAVAQDLDTDDTALTDLVDDLASSSTDRGRIRDAVGTTRGSWRLVPTPRCAHCGTPTPTAQTGATS